MNIKKWIKKNCYSLSGKTICITGSTGGLARKFTKTLVELGANFVFANRNLEKSEQQKQEILAEFPDTKIEIIKTDFSNITSVKNSAKKLLNYNFNFLILNAAIYNVAIEKTESGYNNIFQTNFILPYTFVKLLLPKFKQNKNAKVVLISSIAHKFSKANFDDIDFTKNAKQNKIYGNSKRFITFSLQKLLFLNNVKLSIVHPGITLTNMTNHYPKMVNWLVKLGIKLFFPSPQKASLSIISGVFDETKNEWIGPRIFDIWGYPKKKKLDTCSEQEKDKIFEIAEQIFDKNCQ